MEDKLTPKSYVILKISIAIISSISILGAAYISVLPELIKPTNTPIITTSTSIPTSTPSSTSVTTFNLTPTVFQATVMASSTPVNPVSFEPKQPPGLIKNDISNNFIFNIMLYWVIVPLLFMSILFFDFILMMGQENTQKRIQVIAGGTAGFIISSILIMLDNDFGGVFPELVDCTLNSGLSAMFFMLFLGFFILFVVDLLLRRKVVPFIVMGNIAVINITIYLLISTNTNKSIIIIALISFFVGIIIYYMLFGERVQHYTANAFRPPQNDE